MFLYMYQYNKIYKNLEDLKNIYQFMEWNSNTLLLKLNTIKSVCVEYTVAWFVSSTLLFQNWIDLLNKSSSIRAIAESKSHTQQI